LVDALAGDPARREIFRYAAGGFRDFTRIASSDPKMWHDIALANRVALVGLIDQFSAQLAELRGAIDRSDGDYLLKSFSRAKEARDEFSELLRNRATNNLSEE
jgi:prephenate dehydrogenase